MINSSRDPTEGREGQGRKGRGREERKGERRDGVRDKGDGNEERERLVCVTEDRKEREKGRMRE